MFNVCCSLVQGAFLLGKDNKDALKALFSAVKLNSQDPDSVEQ